MKPAKNKWLILLFFPGLFLLTTSVYAAPLQQDSDPVNQCAIGSQLFEDYKYDEAFPYLEYGFNHSDSAIFSQLDDLGKCALALGRIYGMKGQTDKELQTYQSALQIFRDSDNLKFQSYVLNNIGVIFIHQNKFVDAGIYLEMSLEISRRLGDRVGEGGTLNNIGTLMREQGQFIQAAEYYQQAIEIAREFNVCDDENDALNNLGLLYENLGQYNKALEYFQQQLDLTRRIGDRAGESEALSNMGLVYHGQGRYAKALLLFQQALEISRKVDARSKETTALLNIGGTYSDQGQKEEALEYYERALIVAREIGDTGLEGSILNGMGTIYQESGKYNVAYRNHQQALKIFRENGDRLGEGSVLNNMGLTYKLQGDFTEALTAYQAALQITRDIGDRAGESVTLNNIGALYKDSMRYDEALDSYLLALNISQEVGNRQSEALLLNNIGVVYQQKKQYKDALGYYEKAMLVFEMVRATTGSEFARADYIEQYASLYDRVVELYFQENQPKKAFSTSERGRSRAFLDSMATDYIELNDNAAESLYAQEVENYNIRQSVQNALADAKAQKPPDEKQIADLETQLTKAEKDYQAVLDAISAHGEQLEQLVPGRNKVLDVPQTQAILGDTTTLVSFWVLDKQTLAFIITDKTFDAVSLPIKRADLYAQIEVFRSFPNDDPAFAYPESALKLYQALIEPLKSYLTTSNLIIIPYGELHYLPFAALTDGDHFLVDEYVISYAPSVSALLYIRENAQHKGSEALIIGNPSTDDADLRSLAFAEQEAREVASLYDTEPLLGTVATESKFKKLVSQAGLIHLAVHGTYNAANPLYSALYLAPDEQNDGLLEVDEIYGLDLRQTNLVVLSACETQLGQLSRGDELVGLTRAFFFAGTPTVVASLWSVDDESTAMLMERFYTHLRDGMGKAEALRQAQIDVRTKYPNPYYWAGFVLSGDGGHTVASNKLRYPETQKPIDLPNCGGNLGLIILPAVIAWISRRRLASHIQFKGRK